MTNYEVDLTAKLELGDWELKKLVSESLKSHCEWITDEFSREIRKTISEDVFDKDGTVKDYLFSREKAAVNEKLKEVIQKAIKEHVERETYDIEQQVRRTIQQKMRNIIDEEFKKMQMNITLVDARELP